jgi:hypothetical protein
MKGTKARGQSDFFNLVYAPKKAAFETAKSEFEATKAKFEAEETRKAIAVREESLKEEKLKEHREKEAIAQVSNWL